MYPAKADSTHHSYTTPLNNAFPGNVTDTDKVHLEVTYITYEINICNVHSQTDNTTKILPAASEGVNLNPGNITEMLFEVR